MRSIVVPVLVCQQDVELSHPRANILWRDDICAIRVSLRAADRVDWNEWTDISLGFGETADIRSNDRNTSELSFSGDETPCLLPQGWDDQHADVVVDLSSITSRVCSRLLY